VVPVPDDVIDLSGGLGDPHLFDLAGFNRVLNTVRLRDGVDALDYGDPQGYAPLRRVISGILASQGLEAPSDHILVTAGSQQAITLVASCLLKAGDTVLVERPTYNSALELFRVLGLHVVDIPLDSRGLDLEATRQALETHRPRLVYTMPTYQNPTGICMDLGRRRGLLDLAVRYDVPILEDDFVGDLRFEGRGHPTLKALDQSGHVIYVSTFSKMLLPGLRTGYLVLDGPVFDLLAEHKRLTDLASATLIQRTLAEYVGVGRYQTHLKRSVRLYRQRRDEAAQALGSIPNLRWTLPAGGLFFWLEAPDLNPGQDLAHLAAGVGVRLAPGGPFFAHPDEGRRFGRMNFAAVPGETVAEAIRRLSRISWEG
jgi:GntR family transcriptional regulator/MocR family aminotransferase